MGRLVDGESATEFFRQVEIRRIDAPAGEHRHAACKHHVARADGHQNFGRSALFAVAENDDGSGGDAFAVVVLFGIGHAPTVEREAGLAKRFAMSACRKS